MVYLLIAWWIFPWRTVSHNRRVNHDFPGEIPQTHSKSQPTHPTAEELAAAAGRLGVEQVGHAFVTF